MTWDEVAPDLSTWTLPASRAKNAVAHDVPLSPQAREVLRERRASRRTSMATSRRAEEQETSPALFSRPARGVQWLQQIEGGPRRGQRRQELAASRLAPHARDGPAKARRPPRSDRGRAQPRLGKPRAGIVGVYQRHNWADEKRAALNAWGERVAAIVEGREAGGNVVVFARGG